MEHHTAENVSLQPPTVDQIRKMVEFQILALSFEFDQSYPEEIVRDKVKKKLFEVGIRIYISTDLKEIHFIRNDEEDTILGVLDSGNWLTMDGDRVDFEVLRKYMQQIQESDGFHMDVFPGPIFGVTSIFPLQYAIDERETHPERYQKIMELAAFAISTYNKKHNKEFKVVEIQKVNIFQARDSTYYITFSAVDVKGSNYKKASLRSFLREEAYLIMMTLLIWFCFIWGIKRDLIEKKFKLESGRHLMDTDHELHDKSAARMTFQAVVIDDVIDMEREVRFCRPAA